ncbi:hypothetical protein GCM10009347_01570 [Shewanella algicola]|uniref:Uncharacterized protein n=1 Tax=Shewanella algicola TaxID=640633 RepID=A0A9X1Z223_9GAMM|nr:hypothetical protein [Shewanella algicola]MCL1103741.1 hypothetical protein [Shewanella algicola]GGP37291.1 hypothetical protein GCM10009347_01570 [Shewanella algicola]
MGLPVTVYRWDDAGAPQITDRKPSEILNILRKCLVDGYGTKSPLGWSVVFDEPSQFKTVFRNDPTLGTGSCVSVSPRNGLNNAGVMLDFVPAVDFVDINTSYRRGYSAGVHSFLTSMTKWFVIGNATGFYIIVSDTSPVSGYDKRYDDLCFVGDFNSVIPADAGKFIALNTTNTVGDDSYASHNHWSYTFANTWYTPGTTSPVGKPLKLYNADGADEYREYGVTLPFSPYNGNSATKLATHRSGVYAPIYIQLAGSTLGNMSLDVNGDHIMASSVSPTLRGFMPGLKIEATPRYASESWPVFDVINGQQHLLLRSQTTSAFTWLNCEEW